METPKVKKRIVPTFLGPVVPTIVETKELEIVKPKLSDSELFGLELLQLIEEGERLDYDDLQSRVDELNISYPGANFSVDDLQFRYEDIIKPLRKKGFESLIERLEAKANKEEKEMDDLVQKYIARGFSENEAISKAEDEYYSIGNRKNKAKKRSKKKYSDKDTMVKKSRSKNKSRSKSKKKYLDKDTTVKKSRSKSKSKKKYSDKDTTVKKSRSKSKSSHKRTHKKSSRGKKSISFSIDGCMDHTVKDIRKYAYDNRIPLTKLTKKVQLCDKLKSYKRILETPFSTSKNALQLIGGVPFVQEKIIPVPLNEDDLKTKVFHEEDEKESDTEEINKDEKSPWDGDQEEDIDWILKVSKPMYNAGVYSTFYDILLKKYAAADTPDDFVIEAVEAWKPEGMEDSPSLVFLTYVGRRKAMKLFVKDLASEDPELLQAMVFAPRDYYEPALKLSKKFPTKEYYTLIKKW